MAKKNPGYSEAIKEVEEILSEIEDGDMDVDLLTEKVKRATELIHYCKKKLTQTQEEVSRILDSSEEKDQADSDD